MIVSTGCALLGAERGTLLVCDWARRELWSKVAEGSGEIRVALPGGGGHGGGAMGGGGGDDGGEARRRFAAEPLIAT